MPGLLSWVVKVIRGSKYEASDVVPGPGSNIRRPLSVFPFLHRVPRNQFPGFIGTMRALRLPVAHPSLNGQLQPPSSQTPAPETAGRNSCVRSPISFYGRYEFGKQPEAIDLEEIIQQLVRIRFESDLIPTA